MPFCPKCGRQVPEDAKICDSCGYNLEHAKSAFSANVQRTPQDSSKKSALKSFLTGFFLPLVIIFCIIFPPLIIVVILFIIDYYRGVKNQCPLCKKRFAKEIIGKEFLSDSSGHMTVPHYDAIYNNRGEKIGEVEREELVYLVYNDYLYTYKCKYCGFEWKEIGTETRRV
ncbi:MAG: zinc ribbon domain-containing protein [Nitrososphaeria archaeon]